MKPLQTLLIVSIALGLNAVSVQAADWESEFTALLSKYVKPTGVDYKGWHGNADDLDRINEVAKGIATDKPSGTTQDQLAWYLNAYNALILQQFLDQYPTDNLNALRRTRFFSKKSLNVAGEKMSFKHLEDNIIRSRFNEPRIHFALNCASVSCPPLLNRAYTGETLNHDLNEQTRDFLNSNPLGLRLSKDGKTASVSAIFKWFAGDFDNGDIKGFIDKYRNEPLGKNVKIDYQNYDWRRNDA